jgi:hypothetical protein
MVLAELAVVVLVLMEIMQPLLQELSIQAVVVVETILDQVSFLVLAVQVDQE